VVTCTLVGIVLMGVFRLFISDFPPIYGAVCLYSQFHLSLFVLNRDLVV